MVTVMWRPILERGDGQWVGTTGDSRLSVGTLEVETAPVPLDDPVCLWPLLERPFAEVTRQLAERWFDFGLPASESPQSVVEAIVTSAVRAGRPYWTDRALDYLEFMVSDSRYRRATVESLLLEIGNMAHLLQASRHRAWRIIRTSKEPI